MLRVPTRFCLSTEHSTYGVLYINHIRTPLTSSTSPIPFATAVTMPKESTVASSPNVSNADVFREGPVK